MELFRQSNKNVNISHFISMKEGEKGGEGKEMLQLTQNQPWQAEPQKGGPLGKSNSTLVWWACLASSITNS